MIPLLADTISIVLLVEISPPPVNPLPAVIVTPVWSMCSLATKLVVPSWSTCIEPEIVPSPYCSRKSSLSSAARNVKLTKSDFVTVLILLPSAESNIVILSFSAELPLELRDSR